jgi:hypothetical protein
LRVVRFGGSINRNSERVVGYRNHAANINPKWQLHNKRFNPIAHEDARSGLTAALYQEAMKTESAHYLREYSSLVRSLDALGFELDDYSQTPEAFGNFVADFSNGSVRFRIVRDRSQLILEGAKNELEPFGLWRAFDEPAALEEKLLSWLRSKV